MRGGLLGRRTAQKFRQMAVQAVRSSKIKLLLGCWIVLTLIVFGSRAPSIMGWRDHTTASLDRSSGSSIPLLPPWPPPLQTALSRVRLLSSLIHYLWQQQLLVPCIIVVKSLKCTMLPSSTQSPSTRCNIKCHFEQIRKGYALLINTWKRNDLLKQSISHYTSCYGLDAIHIVWSEPDPPSNSLIEFLNHVVQLNSRDDRQIELKFDINKEDSLNNRFKEIKDLKTDAVFSIDDDIIFPCSSVEFAFSVWRSAPDAMVGFVPRMHWIDQSRGNAARYNYGGWWSVWWRGTYSMVLSKAAFFHKKYLGLYTNNMPGSIKDYVAKNRNCEDIAMSFLVANVTNAPPVWVKGKIFEIGATGISSLGGHIEKRSQCVNKFVYEFGRMPLVSTSMKAVDSRKIWFW